MDTPKGDLDKSGDISGPSKIVIPNNFVYPWGTTEQYPEGTDSNSAHEYVECGNKGICDRKAGACNCFEGYEGSACQRASCPNFCSNHGTCRTIQEIAKLDNGNIYELWDQQTTMGCVCDPGYQGPDCSEKECKVGFDPLYKNNIRGHRYANFTYQIYTYGAAASLAGHYRIIFRDAYGQSWTTNRVAASAPCVDIVDALEGLPNNVIPLNSVACNSVFNSNPSYDPILDGNMYIKVRYTLSFKKNPGKLQQLDLHFHAGNSKKPTLFTSDSSDFGYHVFPNGFTGEKVDFVPDYCEDVTVTLAAGTYTHYLDGLDTLETKYLKRCLGDADGNNENNNANYNWDYGSIANPHLIKLFDASQYFNAKVIDPDGDVDSTQTNAKFPKTTLCNPTELNTAIYGTNLCSAVDPPAFYAVLIYDEGQAKPFRLFTRAAVNYAATTQFYVFTTRGRLQLISYGTAVFNSMSSYSTAQKIDRYYSRTLHITNTTGVHDAYFGAMDCETQNVGSNGLLDCLNKNDHVMFLSLNASTETVFADASANAIYPNMYQITRIHRAENSYLNDPSPSPLNSEKARQTIDVDYGVNQLMRYTAGARWITSDTSARVYKFYPDASSVMGGYEYASTCSTRGICDSSSGICSCFSGFTNDNCDTLSGNFQ